MKISLFPTTRLSQVPDPPPGDSAPTKPASEPSRPQGYGNPPSRPLTPLDIPGDSPNLALTLSPSSERPRRHEASPPSACQPSRGSRAPDGLLVCLSKGAQVWQGKSSQLTVVVVKQPQLPEQVRGFSAQIVGCISPINLGEKPLFHPECPQGAENAGGSKTQS